MTFSSITSNPAVCSWPGGGVTPGLRRHVLWHEYKCEFGYSELELLIEMPDEVVRKRPWVLLFGLFLLVFAFLLVPRYVCYLGLIQRAVPVGRSQFSSIFCRLYLVGSSSSPLLTTSEHLELRRLWKTISRNVILTKP